MHQLQWSICLNWTEGSPRHLSFKCLAVWASPHYGAAILCQHGLPEPLLSKSQGPLLALMTGIMMHPVKCQAALTHRNDKGQHSLCLTFWGHVYVHETLVQDEAVANKEEHLALFRLCLCSKALLEESIPPEWWHALSQSHLQHPASATSASWACSQSTMCIGSSFIA